MSHPIPDEARRRIVAKLIVPSDDPDACWGWQGPKDRHGYTVFRWTIDGRSFWTGGHRATYRVLVGEIPDGLVLDHLCRNRSCTNPLHVEPVTNRENLRRGETGTHLRRRRVGGFPVCANGHVVAGIAGRIDKRGYLLCRYCDLDAANNYRRRQGLPLRGTTLPAPVIIN